MSGQYQMRSAELSGNAVKSPYYHPEAEWPLIIYTVSLQGAAGTLLWSLLWSGWGKLPAEKLLVILVLGAIGMLGASAHLASPLRAPRAILNWRCSWLSREIVLSSAFLGLVVLDGGLSWQQILIGRELFNSALLSGAVRILAGFTGIALLGAMSMIYLVPTRPVWNHYDTLVSFYTGAMQIGWAILAAMIAVHTPLLRMATMALITTGLILLTLLRLKVVLKVIDRLSALDLYQRQSWGWLNNKIRRIRIALALAGGIAAPLVGSAVMFLPWISRGANTQWIWVLAALLLIMGEGLDRWVFFQASPAVIFPPRF